MAICGAFALPSQFFSTATKHSIQHGWHTPYLPPPTRAIVTVILQHFLKVNQFEILMSVMEKEGAATEKMLDEEMQTTAATETPHLTIMLSGCPLAPSLNPNVAK